MATTMNEDPKKGFTGKPLIESDQVEVPYVPDHQGLGMLDVPFYEASPRRYWLTLVAIAAVGALGLAGYLMVG
jgi:hypothetical protein